MSNAARAFRDLPSSWSPPDTQRRFADVGSYDVDNHTCEAVLSTGAPVQRLYGVEVLLITPSAVDLGRAKSGLVPLIDSHQVQGIGNVLGRVDDVTFEKGKLVGRLVFDDSDAGRKAEGMAARRIVRSVSIGYRVDLWSVTDDEGNVIDPERERMAWDEDYTFTAKRWELLEVSLVSVPADASAMIRSSGSMSPMIVEDRLADILARMRARQRIATRERVLN
jgi:hypothetical protein